jgi:hypothetical protein
VKQRQKFARHSSCSLDGSCATGQILCEVEDRLPSVIDVEEIDRQLEQLREEMLYQGEVLVEESDVKQRGAIAVWNV